MANTERRTFTDTQRALIIGKVKAAAGDLGVQEACKKAGITGALYYQWLQRSKTGDTKGSKKSTRVRTNMLPVVAATTNGNGGAHAGAAASDPVQMFTMNISSDPSRRQVFIAHGDPQDIKEIMAMFHAVQKGSN